MALDQYSFCPCGSGKKIKFCKCFENLQEMVKVDRMIEGDQSIAALDRINLLMKTFPSDAWLHALKCALLLKLREIESLEEASAKFIRLRPDNPLALLYRALLAIIRGNSEECATLYLQSLAETTESVHPLMPTVASNLVTVLVRGGNVVSALLHCETLMDVLGESSDVSMRMYNAITSMDSVNIIARETIPSISEPEDAPWQERFREAYVLLRNLRVPQARSKFEALQREFGPADEILVALLHCKLLLVDVSGAATTCGKLAQSTTLSEAQRVYFQALQFEIDPEGTGLSHEDEICQYSITNDGEVEEKMIGSKNLMSVEDDQLRQMVMAVANEEVSPKHVSTIAIPLFEGRYAESNPRLTGGWMALFGRQTDKEPRVLMSESTVGNMSATPAKLREEFGLTNRQVLQKVPTPYHYHVATQVILAKPLAIESRQEFEAALKQMSIDGFLDFPFKFLEGKTPRESSSNPAMKTKLLAILLHWEGMGSAMLSHRDFVQLHATLGLTQPTVDASDDTFDLVGGASYYWTDLASIDADSLIRLMQSAMSRGVSVVYEQLVLRAKTMIWPEEMRAAADYTTLNMEVRIASDPNEAEKLLEKIYEIGKGLGLPIGNAVLERVELLSQMGRQNDAGLFLQRALREVPEDPVLIQYIQAVRYQMQQQQMGAGGADLNSALMRRGAARPAAAPAASASGIWTPDQGAPTAAPVAAEEERPASKLWLPGQ